MTDTTQVVAEEPVVADDIKPVLDTPEVTATEGEVDKPEQVKEERTFSQAEVDALIQKRLLKEERRVHRRIEAQQREQQFAQKATVEPKREEFRDDETFTAAQIDHIATKRALEILEQRDQATKSEQRAETFLEKAEKASERYADFQTVVNNPSLPINADMAEFMAESDLGADVAYYLGKNPIKCAAISRLSPIAAARELLRIETELSAKPKATPSNAPDPIKPLGSRGKATSSALPSDHDSIDAWMKKEAARVRAR